MMACVWRRAGGGIDGYTYLCPHDTAADSDVGLEGHEKGRFGEGPTNYDRQITQVSEGSATSGWAEVIPFSCGGDTAELLNEAVRWPFTSVLREWRTKGKGFQKLKDEREAFAHRFGRQLGFFLSTGEYLQQLWDLSEALHSELCVRGQLVSLEVMYAATVAETGQDRIWKEVRSVSSG